MDWKEVQRNYRINHKNRCGEYEVEVENEKVKKIFIKSFKKERIRGVEMYEEVVAKKVFKIT